MKLFFSSLGNWIKPISLIVAFLIFSFGTLTVLAKAPSEYLTKISDTPDLMQTLKQAKFLGGGKKFCAPVAASNALVWLGNHGYPNLLPNSLTDPTAAQVKMVHLLASEKMMNTGERGGTGPRRLIRGINHYVESCGYRCSKIVYQGWRTVPKEYRHKQQVPDLEWMKNECANNRSAVLWNIGWYKAGGNGGEFERLGGHWLTLVGYERVGYESDKKNSPTGELFVLHDPATRAGKSISHEKVFLNKIKTGVFVGTRAGLPLNAKGYYSLGGNFHLKNIADYAILDGVVVLELEETTLGTVKEKENEY